MSKHSRCLYPTTVQDMQGDRHSNQSHQKVSDGHVDKQETSQRSCFWSSFDDEDQKKISDHCHKYGHRIQYCEDRLM